MSRVLFAISVFLVALPSLVLAQSYQHASDGLVAVHVKKIVEAGGGIGFDVCAQLTRREKVGPLDVHLNFWGTSGGILARASSVVRPEVAAPVCQRIFLPSHARGYGRWEISRFRFQRSPMPQVASRPTQEG